MADLPDDLTRWPSDPYAILGVAPGQPTREIRKAYTELIRRFKPERLPEHFRRIREAYDQVQLSEKWRTPPLGDVPPAPLPASADVPIDAPIQLPREPVAETPQIEPLDAPPVPLPPLPPLDIPPPLTNAPSAPPPDSESDELWDRACTGEHAAVYRELRDRVHSGQPNEKLYLQLYWLLAAFPELDHELKPLDWPVRALAAGFETGRAVDMIYAELLFRRELCRHSPLVQLADRIRNPDTVIRLYQMRWQAALGYGQWTFVLDELPKARQRLFDHAPQLATLLGWLIGWMAWSREDHVRRHLRECRAEIETVASGNRNFDYVLERLDFLDELSSHWRRLHDAAFLEGEIYELLPVSWTGTAGEIRWRIFALYQRIVKNPNHALSALDALSHSAPLVIAQLLMTAQQTYFGSRGVYRAPPADIAAVFASLRASFSDNPMRLEVLDLLYRERLSVDDILNAIPFRDSPEATQNLLAQIGSDTPLRLVNLAQLTLGG